MGSAHKFAIEIIHLGLGALAFSATLEAQVDWVSDGSPGDAARQDHATK